MIIANVEKLKSSREKIVNMQLRDSDYIDTDFFGHYKPIMV